MRALIVVITNAPDLHGYCARAMYRALQRDLATADSALITASTWVIGQFDVWGPHSSGGWWPIPAYPSEVYFTLLWCCGMLSSAAFLLRVVRQVSLAHTATRISQALSSWAALKPVDDVPVLPPMHLRPGRMLRSVSRPP